MKRNIDEEKRRLERKAQEGDAEAAAKLRRSEKRLGEREPDRRYLSDLAQKAVAEQYVGSTEVGNRFYWARVRDGSIWAPVATGVRAVLATHGIEANVWVENPHFIMVTGPVRRGRALGVPTWPQGDHLPLGKEIGDKVWSLFFPNEHPRGVYPRGIALDITSSHDYAPSLEEDDWEIFKAGVKRGLGGKRKNPDAWTDEDESALREEVERRFRERTPPRRVDEVLVETRVGRSEMRNWATQTLKKPIPELDTSRGFERWYRGMALRAIEELDDAEALATAKARFRSSKLKNGLDEDLRRLERAAKTGDQAAQVRLDAMKARAGAPPLPRYLHDKLGDYTQNAHNCEDPTCEVAVALDHGFNIHAARWLLTATDEGVAEVQLGLDLLEKRLGREWLDYYADLERAEFLDIPHVVCPACGAYSYEDTMGWLPDSCYNCGEAFPDDREDPEDEDALPEPPEDAP